MYFVDREKIERQLKLLESMLHTFKETSWKNDVLHRLALERIVHLMIEGLLDVGNAMIDGFIMRDPGSYEDIIDILIDEKVVTAEQGAGLKQIVVLRKSIVQEYMDVNHEEIEQIISANIGCIQDYPSCIREYLEKELGPVSAFKA